MRTVAISLKLSDTAFCLGGLIMPPVWQARSSNSRVAAESSPWIGVIVDAGQHIGEPGVRIDVVELACLPRAFQW
jgi:hypothetical protein